MAAVLRVFDGVCRVMTRPPCHFFLKEGAVPVKIRGSRPVSEPLRAPFQDELAAQIKQGIIRKVRPEEVTPWIHGVVVVPKKQGGIRFCPDYRPLNKFLIGSKFDNPTPFQSVRSIPKGMRFFTVVDALKGYHQCALDTESMALTTFATPEGLHQYTRLPMGISNAGDDYGRRFSDIFGHIPNTARCMEDLVIYSRTYEEHINLLRMLFKTANDNNVSFNKSKTVFSSVRSMLEAEDSAMSEIMAILDVKVCGPSPSSSEGAPGALANARVHRLRHCDFLESIEL